MKKSNKNVFSIQEKFSTVLFIIFGLLGASRGVYWVTNSRTAINDSALYAELNRIAPLYVWGTPFIIGGVLLIVSCIFMINRKTAKEFGALVVLGGLISGLAHILLATASVPHNLNWLTPVQNLCLAIGFFAILEIGISFLWNNEHKKN